MARRKRKLRGGGLGSPPELHKHWAAVAKERALTTLRHFNNTCEDALVVVEEVKAMGVHAAAAKDFATMDLARKLSVNARRNAVGAASTR